jgi:hypothetical protein
MKASSAILLLSALFCGCSHDNDISPRSTLDRVQAGKDLSFGHYVLHVEKREGSSLEGVRIVSSEQDGQTVTITAKRGTLSEGSDRSFITVVLHEAQTEKGKQKALVDELTINLPIIGL